MKHRYSLLWAGNDESFSTYMLALEQGQLGAKGYVGGNDDDEDDDKMEPSRLLSVIDGVGIVSIQGTLTNTDAWYNRYYGLVSYGEIIEALHQAAMDASVKEILMDVGSPGGAVSGVLDAVRAVEKIGSVKRITAFTSSVAASAGFWIIAPARERYVTETAISGSIGVVAKHVEYSKYLKDLGVTETIFRSGPYKQVVNSSEPLSKKAEEVIQEQVDYTSQIFTQSVADYLGVSYQAVDSRMGQGREFIGQQGVDVGLVDAVSSIDEVFARIQTRISKDDGGIDMKKKYGMAAAVAAASAGINLEASQDAPAKTAEEIAAEAAAQAENGTESSAEDEKGTETSADGENGSEAGESEDTDSSSAETADAGDAVTLLKAQLKEQGDELLEAKVQIRSLEKDLESMKALKTVVATAINNMSVAFGGTANDKLAEEPASALVALHETMLAKTVETFKTGGLSDAAAESETPAVAESRFDRAKSQAVRFPQKTK